MPIELFPEAHGEPRIELLAENGYFTMQEIEQADEQASSETIGVANGILKHI